MTPLLSRLFLAGVLLLVSLPFLVAGERGKSPTEAEWSPVATALKENAPDVIDQVATITRRFPDWPFGFIKLAELQFQADHQEAAQEAAARAFALDGTDHDAAKILMQVRLKLAKYPGALEVYLAWGNRRDLRGWLHYLAAKANFHLTQYTAANSQLDSALSLANESDQGAPLEYHFLKGQLLQAAGDLKGAIASFNRGIEDTAEFADHWFNLGVLQRQLAYGQEELNLEQLRRAQESLRLAAKYRGQDPDVQMALGLVCLGLQEFVDASGLLGNALEGYRATGEVDTKRIADIESSLGLAILRRAEADQSYELFVEAISHFKRAETLGRKDRSVYNNMMAAIIGADKQSPTEGDRRQWQKESTRLMPEDGASLVDPINLMVQYYQRACDQQDEDPHTTLASADRALEMSKRVNPQALEPETRKNFYRYVGHINGLKADCQAVLLKDGKGDEALQQTTLRLATEAYAQAGDERDFLSRDFFLFRMAQRGPVAAFDGGWRYLVWKKFFSLSALTLMIKEYGAAQAWKRPVHQVVWGVLLVICLALFIKGFFFPRTITEDAGRRRSRTKGDPDVKPTDERKPATNERPSPPRKTPANEAPRNSVAEPPPRKAAPPAPAPRAGNGVDETVAVTAPPKAQRRSAPGLSNRGAVNDVVARRIAKQKEEQQGATAAPKQPPRRRR